MNLDDSLTSSQIGKFEDSQSAAGPKTKISHSPPEYFLRDFKEWQGMSSVDLETDKKLLRQATKAWHQLPPKLKVKYLIKIRVQTSQERKIKDMKVKKTYKEKPLQNGVLRSSKFKRKRKVILVEPSLKILRPKMIARRPTPLPSPRKRKENRSRTLPKYVPYRQKSSKL
ncbi:uncharacterized protein LOC119549354 [Drosophila subpulchrella]|uniref:uncharacterized protein LOC119549354 n=1 Tax=Drosophila subpulchrella TaxID=1486046 RepID=UPI0018A156DA|nr:uncharacterized protein LOC119549354 [Drosophila subpulchrella]